MGDLGIAVALVEICKRSRTTTQSPMSVEIGPNAYALVVFGQTCQGKIYKFNSSSI